MGIRGDWQKLKSEYKKSTGTEFKMKGDFGPSLDKAEKAKEAVEKAKGKNDPEKLAALKLKAAPYIKSAYKTSGDYMKVITMARKAAEKEAKKDKKKQALAKSCSMFEAGATRIRGRLFQWAQKIA